MNKISVIIADDHPLFRTGVRQTLETDPLINVLGEANNGREALDIIFLMKPAVAVLDINMPLLTGLQVTRELKKSSSETEIVLLTMFDDEDILNEAMDLQVKAYILKDSAALDIISAVHSTASGHNFISPSLIAKLTNKRKQRNETSSLLSQLTEKELMVLKFISEYKSTKEIADEIFLSPKTIENYRYRISEKLQLKGAYSVLKFALENKEHLPSTVL